MAWAFCSDLKTSKTSTTQEKILLAWDAVIHLLYISVFWEGKQLLLKSTHVQQNRDPRASSTHWLSSVWSFMSQRSRSTTTLQTSKLTKQQNKWITAPVGIKQLSRTSKHPRLELACDRAQKQQVIKRRKYYKTIKDYDKLYANLLFIMLLLKKKEELILWQQTNKGRAHHLWQHLACN